VLEALTFERNREAALRDQIEAVILEEDGPRIDRSVQALLTPDELALVGDLFLALLEDDDLDDGFVDDAADGTVSEIDRLAGEVERSQARQRALERLAGLLESPLAEPTPEATRETAL
jgi:hypothetical protein